MSPDPIPAVPAPTPAPVPTPSPRTWREILTPYVPVLLRIGVTLLALSVGALLHYLGASPTVVTVVEEVVKEVPVAVAQSPVLPPLDVLKAQLSALVQQPEYAPTMGWHRDPDVIAANLDPAKTQHFEKTPAGKAVLGDDDVFLWQTVRKVNNRGPPWYPNVNQQSVGCCVGAGWKHSADACQASAIASGKAFEWLPVSVEVIYAGSRVDVGGGRISGDGSMGAWAAKYVSSKGGIVAMQKYASADLSTFSPARARQWGKSGVPADITAAAKQHPVKSCALVKSWADVKRSIQQGYPVAVCSDQGFTMERDATGKARPQGTWNHCMAIIGVRSGASEGGFVLNSWGDQAHTGPVWPADAPVAGFWADASVIDRMVSQGDSFALADVEGFPARKIDWIVRAEPARGRFDLFAHNAKLEVALSW
jgi:hypothetical protein